MNAPLTDDPITAHANGCACARCVGLEVCPACGEQKLDIDWCFNCRKLVFLITPRGCWACTCIECTGRAS